MRSRYMALFALALSSCAPIQERTYLESPVNQSRQAGVGDVILRAETRENMPNVFGAADIFGRTRSTGTVIVQYGGLHDGKAVLLRGGVTTQSDATTMNSTGFFAPTQQTTFTSGMVGATPVTASSTTTGSVYIPPRGGMLRTLRSPQFQ